MRDNAPYVNIHTHKKVENELTIKCFGVHPLDVSCAQTPTLSQVESSVQAIGEIGLDMRHTESIAQQEKVFRTQLSIAEQLSLPTVIHCVRAFNEVLTTLANYNLPAVIFHGFVGSPQMATQATNRGYYLSFGHRCFSSPKTIEALKTIEPQRLFLETDMQNVSIEEIYAQAARVRGEELGDLKRQIYDNYINIFKKQ